MPTTTQNPILKRITPSKVITYERISVDELVSALAARLPEALNSAGYADVIIEKGVVPSEDTPSGQPRYIKAVQLNAGGPAHTALMHLRVYGSQAKSDSFLYVTVHEPAERQRITLSELLGNHAG